VLERGLECVLDGVLREGGIARRPGDSGDRAAPLLPEDTAELDYAETSASRMTSGRTSTTPCVAAGIFAAHAIASSSESASIR
jgi:hypothetical protein